MRRPALALLVLALPACDPSTPQPSTSASAGRTPPPVASAPGATGDTPSAAAPPPPDLDLAAQQKALKCAADARSGLCGVLAKMGSCSPWNPIVPSGDGRWLGRGWLVEGAKTTDQFTLVRARRVPTGEVGPGQIGVRVSITDLPKQEGAAWDQADRVIRAFERADVPPHGNPTIEYVKQRKDWPETFAMRTAGGQVHALTPGGAYLCQGPNRALLVVQRAATGGAGGDGLYAELWPTSW